MEFTKYYASWAAQRSLIARRNLLNRAAESANAIFLAAFGKIFFDIATIDQNIFAVTIALVKFRLRQRAFNSARHDRF